MRSVAVVTLGRLRIAQLGDFAVVCIEVRLGNVLVTTSAFGHDVQLESGFVGTADRVSTMTITANGERFVGLPYFEVMYTLLELFLDTMMTPSTRCRDIIRIDA